MARLNYSAVVTLGFEIGLLESPDVGSHYKDLIRRSESIPVVSPFLVISQSRGRYRAFIASIYVQIFRGNQSGYMLNKWGN